MKNQKMNEIITIDESKCNGCRTCDKSCPMVKYLGYNSIFDGEYKNCFKCGHCVAICPKHAIQHSEIGIKDIISETRPTEDQMHQYIISRRSTRDFKNEKISEEHWKKIIDVVKYAQTSCNSEQVDLVIIEDKHIMKDLTLAVLNMLKDLKKKFNTPVLGWMFKTMMGAKTFNVFKNDLDKVEVQFNSLNHGHDPILFNAPAIILFVGDKREVINNTDTMIAAQNVALLAPSLGMGTCYSGVLQMALSGLSKEIKKIIQLPKNQKVYTTLVVGYEKFKYKKVPERKNRNVTWF